MPTPMTDGPGTKRTRNAGNPPGPPAGTSPATAKRPAGAGDQDARPGTVGAGHRQGQAVPTGIAYRDHPRIFSTDGGPVTPPGAARD
jgi:hypothetical protein